MIITVTLNPAVDKTFTVEGFLPDRIYRPCAAKTTAGGKGINVARMLGTLGRDALATGFLGGHNGELVSENLDQEGIKHDFIRTAGESRLCVKIVDPDSITQTEINEPGPVVTLAEVSALHQKVRTLLTGADHLIMSGSAPPGVPSDFYARAIEDARAASVISVLDTSGEHMRQGIAAVPDIAKPNVEELSEYAGRPLESRQEVLEAAESLIGIGVDIVVVSMGRDGAIAADGREAWHAAPPVIEFVSAVGSGDCMVAAFVDAIALGKNLADALAAGTAAGSGNAMTHGAGFCSRECFDRLLPQVTLTRL